ncbi:MAG: diaminobutyrate--2-oxoglutarate transaminase [Burkholderiaceae bacterium]
MDHSAARRASALASELSRRHLALTQPYDLSSHAILERQARQESNARSYPRRLPLVLKRAAGVYVEDIEGRVFIDCLAGAGTLALGHNHPVVIEAIGAALDAGLPLHTLDLSTPVKDRFVQDLFDVLPGDFARKAKVQFCGPSGADAIEAAAKLVKTATGRGTLLAFQGAYHGMTQATLQLMGSLGPKVPLNGILTGVQFLPYPYDYRCPMGLRGDAGAQAGLRYIESVLSDPEGGVPAPAGLILEAVQGEGGVIPAPAAWLQKLRALTAATDVPLILDEVQSGFGRTGKMFAFEHAGITPDVVALSKAIGGGLPLAVIVYQGELDQWKPGAHAGTFRGNQLAMAAGSATIRFIRDEGLTGRARELGGRLSSALEELKAACPLIGDVRGRGLMLGAEIVEPSGALDAHGYPAAAPALARTIQQECLRRGLILELGGRHGCVVRFLPPLTITECELDRAVDIFGQSLRAATKTIRNESVNATHETVELGAPI